MDGVRKKQLAGGRTDRAFRRELAWIRWGGIFRWHRILGISALSLAAYFVIFVVFGKTEVGWRTSTGAPRFQWPNLPAFTVEKSSSLQSEDQETIYTVPSRQLTPRELAQIDASHRTEKPAGK
jgi:hypothetical protein